MGWRIRAAIIGIFDGNREEAAGEFSSYRPFQRLWMLYMDGPDHADDDGALSLLIRPVEVELSAIFIFCLCGCWVGWKMKRRRFDALRIIALSESTIQYSHCTL